MTDAVGPSDLPYRLAWRSRALRHGAHRSTQAGAGGVFRDLASLIQHPDPRRIDLRQSLRDPFGALHVRRFEEKSAICVSVILDVSASMAFEGTAKKLELARAVIATVASSARRTGDTFALYGCDSEIVPDLAFPPSRSRAREQEMSNRLARFSPRRQGTAGLIEAAQALPTRRGLVIVISDFFMPRPEIEALFEALASHDVLTLLLSDSSEQSALPDWGLLPLRDLETGRRRLVAMRPSLKIEWGRRSEARRNFVRQVASRHGRDVVDIEDKVDWERLGSALLAGA